MLEPAAPPNREIAQSAIKEEDNSNPCKAKFQRLSAVHNAPFPAKEVGAWVYDPNPYNYSRKHLMCLYWDRGGQCHSKIKRVQKLHKSRLRFVRQPEPGFLRNSPGIVEGQDLWVWKSNGHPDYPLLHPRTNIDLIRKMFRNSRVYIIGDSVTYQWIRALKCELKFILGLPDEKKVKAMRYENYPIYNTTYRDQLKRFLSSANPNDFITFNMGHWFSRWKVGETWIEVYKKRIREFLLVLDEVSVAQGIPPNQIFFVTTTIRHFWAGHGDWNNRTAQIGAFQPDMNATWDQFGGDNPVLPELNLQALESVLLRTTANTSNSHFSILDISPMILPRADATFDGLHMCLPGPLEYVNQMLYAQMLSIQESKDKEMSNSSNKY